MIYQVRRFSEEDEKKKSHLGRNLLIGAGLASGVFGVAKAGMLGTGAMRTANNLWAKGGKLIGSQKMIKSGQSGVMKANAKDIGKTISNAPKVTPGTTPVAESTRKQAQQNIINSIPTQQSQVPLANAGQVAAENAQKAKDFWMSGLNL